MGSFDSKDVKGLPFIIALLAIFVTKAVDDPGKLSVIGDWIAVFGDTLGAIGGTQEFIEGREEEKRKIECQIKELEKRLEKLK